MKSIYKLLLIVLVISFSSCEKEKTYEELNIKINIDNALSSNFSSDGELSVTVEGGADPFTYEWKDNKGNVIGTDSKIVDLSSGTFSVSVTDSEAKKKEDTIEFLSENIYKDGIFISNEGAFGNGNASVSFIDFNGEVKQSLFKSTNSRDLGDVLQSVLIDDDNVYLVVNNSNKVEVVSANTFKEKGVIPNLKSPRYIIEEDGKLYISQWNNTSVGIFDASTLKEVSSVTVGSGPEGLISVNDEVWVANSGGWSTDNTISVIKTSDNSVRTIDLPGDNPKHFVEDSEGDIWVLCSGKVIYDTDYSIKEETPSKLIEIDASTKAIKKQIELSATVHYGQLRINDDENTLYYGGGFGVNGIFKLSTSSSSASSTAFISGYFYGFNIDENDNVYGTFAGDWKSNGSVNKYDSTGSEVITYEAGIGANGVVFNN